VTAADLRAQPPGRSVLYGCAAGHTCTTGIGCCPPPAPSLVTPPPSSPPTCDGAACTQRVWLLHLQEQTSPLLQRPPGCAAWQPTRPTLGRPRGCGQRRRARVRRAALRGLRHPPPGALRRPLAPARGGVSGVCELRLLFS